ncbi:DUF420 domain-containing protein, partial [Thermus scotoductus]|uniref:DUF420 domain-containing protein n=1 Tax=Thermus scotoductus TaxID=37636 RepID=UPI0010001D33
MKALLGFLAVWSIVLSGLALVTGVVLIKTGNRMAPHRALLTPPSLALLFLVFSLAKWALHGAPAYGGPEAWWRASYLFLITHSLFPAVNGPLALCVPWRAFRGGSTLHTPLARVLFCVCLTLPTMGSAFSLDSNPSPLKPST